MVNYIGKVTIYVKNQEEAKKFWTEKMDFCIRLELPMGPQMTWLEVAPNENAVTSFILYEKELMLSQNPQANVTHPSVLLSTEDIESAYNKMKERGVQVGELMTMPYGKMFTFQDQDGNSYVLREDK